MFIYLFWGVLLLLLILVFSEESYRAKLRYYFNTYLLVIVVLFFVISIVVFPSESVEAAYGGLVTWFTIVLPSLLPFFIGAELLIGLGVVKFIGVLLEPIMRPVFNVPGEGSFAFTMSITSGYPVGAKIVTRLRTEGQLSMNEAQRLAAFCSTSGPLFLMGAVGVGMFRSSQVGFFITLVHYLSAILVGIVFRFYRGSRESHHKPMVYQGHIIKKALRQLVQSRRSNPPFGILLGNAVKESFNTMLMVGGFIILFSVITNVLSLIGVSDFIVYLLRPLGINSALMKAIFVGIFEITNGSQIVAEISQVSLLARMAAASFIIAWSGFSIHAQAISIISTSDIKTGLYLISKLLHGALALILVYCLYPLLSPFIDFVSPAAAVNQINYVSQISSNLKLSVELFMLVIIGLFFFALLVSILLTIIEKLRRGRR